MYDDVRKQVDEVVKDLNIKPLAKRFVAEMIAGFPFGQPLSVPLITDYGVDSDDHYYALQEVIKSQFRDVKGEQEYNRVLRKVTKDFDKAYGHGKRLTSLVKKYAPQYAGVDFATSWDVIYGRAKEANWSRQR